LGLSAFYFIDKITEIKKNEELTAFYTLKDDEEFLEDHFKGFPVMPGVLLLEALKQAAFALLVDSSGSRKSFFRLTAVRDVRFGRFVRPGDRLRIWVRFLKSENSLHFLEGRIDSPSLDKGKTLSAELVFQAGGLFEK